MLFRAVPPNPSLKLTRYGRYCKPGLRLSSNVRQHGTHRGPQPVDNTYLSLIIGR